MNMLNFLDGLDGLAAGVAAIAGFTFCVIALSLGKPEPALLVGDRLRRVPRLPAPQLLSGADLHGRLRRAAARVRARDRRPSRACSRRPRPSPLVLAAARPRGADRRTRRSSSRGGSSTGSPCGSPTARTCTTASSTSASRSGARRDLPLRLVRDARRGRARDPVPPPRRTATGSSGRRSPLPRSPSSRVGASVYIVVRARDRQARQPAHPPARGSGARGGAQVGLVRRDAGLGAVEEVAQPLVEPGRARDAVACARQHRALRLETLLEHVADGVERRRCGRPRRRASGTARAPAARAAPPPPTAARSTTGAAPRGRAAAAADPARGFVDPTARRKRRRCASRVVVRVRVQLLDLVERRVPAGTTREGAAARRPSASAGRRARRPRAARRRRRRSARRGGRRRREARRAARRQLEVDAVDRIGPAGSRAASRARAVPVGERPRRRPRRGADDAPVDEHEPRPRSDRSTCTELTKSAPNPFAQPLCAVTSGQSQLWYARRRDGAARAASPFHPPGQAPSSYRHRRRRSALGALVGWAGRVGRRSACSSAPSLGVPAGVFAVYRRYRGAFS